MRRPRQRRYVTREHAFNRRQRMLRDLEARGFVEVATVEDGERTVHIYVPPQDRRSHAEIARYVADALATEAEEPEDTTTEEE